MTNKELLEQIQKEKNNLFAKSNYSDLEADFFQNFNQYLNSGLIENIVHIDICDFMIAYITSQSKKFSFLEIYNIIKKFQDIDDDLSVARLISISMTTHELVEKFPLEKLEQIFDKKEFKKLKLDNQEKSTISILNHFQQIQSIDLFPFIELFSKEKELLSETLALITVFKGIMFNYNDYQRFALEFEIKYHKKPSEKDIKKIFSGLILSEFNIDFIREVFKDIERYSNKIISEEKNRQRKNRKELNYYMYLETWLNENLKNQEITNIPKEISQIGNKELGLSILKYIYEHNMNGYSTIKDKYDDLSSNSYNQYSLLLKKYNIDISSYHIDITKDIHMVENILEILYSLGIKAPEQLVSVINDSKLEIVENIRDFIYKGFISLEFVKNNIEIFSSKYLNLISNIEQLKLENLSISNMKKIENSLIEEPNKIQKNIRILKQYSLLSKLSTCKSSLFLSLDNLEEKIDLILELELERFLLKDLSLLDINSESFKRIIILHRLNIPIENIDQLYSILNDQKFMIPNEDIDNYIFDIHHHENKILDEKPISKDDFIKLLSSYQKGDRIYNLNGISISKNKILRQLTEYKDDILSSQKQLDIVTYHTILDNEELENITKFIFSLEKQYKK